MGFLVTRTTTKTETNSQLLRQWGKSSTRVGMGSGPSPKPGRLAQYISNFWNHFRHFLWKEKVWSWKFRLGPPKPDTFQPNLTQPEPEFYWPKPITRPEETLHLNGTSCNLHLAPPSFFSYHWHNQCSWGGSVGGTQSGKIPLCILKTICQSLRKGAFYFICCLHCPLQKWFLDTPLASVAQWKDKDNVKQYRLIYRYSLFFLGEFRESTKHLMAIYHRLALCLISAT